MVINFESNNFRVWHIDANPLTEQWLLLNRSNSIQCQYVLKRIVIFKIRHPCFYSYHIDGLVQNCSNSSALAMELLQSCTKPSIIPLTWAHSFVVFCFVTVMLSGVGVTKPIFSVSFFQLFRNPKTLVTCMISRSYLTGVTAAELHRHMWNMKVI